MERRHFLTKTAVAAGATAVALADAPNVIAQQRYHVGACPPRDARAGRAPGRRAEDGQDGRRYERRRLKIQVFAGAS